MPRELTTAMKTAMAAQTGTIVHFISMVFSGGTAYLTTAPRDVLWNSQTWEGIGGVLSFEPIEESPDGRATGTTVQISAVDQTILAAILGQNFRGRKIEIYEAHVDDAGDIIADPMLCFEGFMNAGVEIRETRRERAGGTVDIRLRVVSRVAELSRINGIRTNIASHQTYYSDDTFFQNTPGIAHREIVWGK